MKLTVTSWLLSSICQYPVRLYPRSTLLLLVKTSDGWILEHSSILKQICRWGSEICVNAGQGLLLTAAEKLLAKASSEPIKIVAKLSFIYPPQFTHFLGFGFFSGHGFWPWKIAEPTLVERAIRRPSPPVRFGPGTKISCFGRPASPTSDTAEETENGVKKVSESRVAVAASRM